MTGIVGGELPTMQALVKTFTQNATDAENIKRAVNSSLDSTVWKGSNADQFRSAWTTYSANLDKLNQALTDAATDVKNNHNGIARATGEPEM